MDIYIRIQERAEGRYEGSCPQLPGCWAHGRSVAETESKIVELARGYLASLNVAPPWSLRVRSRNGAPTYAA